MPDLSILAESERDRDAICEWEAYFKAKANGECLKCCRQQIGAKYIRWIRRAATAFIGSNRAYRGQHSVDDFVSIGYLALLTRIETWVPEAGGFWAYANRRVNGSFLDELRRHDYMSRTQRDQSRESGTGRVEMDEEVVEYELCVDDDGSDLVDTLEDRMADGQRLWVLAKAYLTQQQFEVLLLGEKHGWTRVEIGRKFGQSPAWVSAMSAEAMDVLKLAAMSHPETFNERRRLAVINQSSK